MKQMTLSPSTMTGRPSEPNEVMRRAFSSLRHRNFRLYFFGMLASVIGTWGQNVAQAWLVYDLTSSPFALGVVAFAPAVPVLLLAPWAGVVIDRTPRRTMLLITQSTAMMLAFILAALTFTDTVQVWHVVVLSGLLGVVNAFDAPTRQTFVIDMVGREDLGNAIALNSATFSAARVIGPALGGALMAIVGPAWTFLLNGISFLAIIGSLLAMHLPRPQLNTARRTPMADLTEGVRFISRDATIVALIALTLAIGLLGGWFMTLLPVIAQEVLNVAEVGFSLLMAAVGTGSLVSTLMIAYLSDRPGQGHRLTLMNLAFPVFTLMFAVSRSYPLSLGLLVIMGLTYIPQLSLVNTLIQTNIPDALRGRVMSVYALSLFGAFPIGGLIAGTLADRMGAPTTVAVSAVAMLLVGLTVRAAVPRLQRLP
jgi:MFS family permease